MNKTLTSRYRIQVTNGNNNATIICLFFSISSTELKSIAEFYEMVSQFDFSVLALNDPYDDLFETQIKKFAKTTTTEVFSEMADLQNFIREKMKIAYGESSLIQICEL